MSERKEWYGEGRQPWDDILELGWGPEFAAANVLKYLRRSKSPEHSLESAQWYFRELCKMALADLWAGIDNTVQLKQGPYKSKTRGAARVLVALIPTLKPEEVSRLHFRETTITIFEVLSKLRVRPNE